MPWRERGGDADCASYAKPGAGRPINLANWHRPQKLVPRLIALASRSQIGMVAEGETALASRLAVSRAVARTVFRHLETIGILNRRSRHRIVARLPIRRQPAGIAAPMPPAGSRMAGPRALDFWASVPEIASS